MVAAETESAPLKVAQKAKFPTKTKKEKENKKKKEIDNSALPLYSDAETKKTPLTQTEQSIMDQLQQGCSLVDDLIAATGLPAGTVSASLTMLQIKGLVKLLPGKRVQMNE